MDKTRRLNVAFILIAVAGLLLAQYVARRARGALSLAGANDEREEILNRLLAELDGFDPREAVVLLAAANRPEILDPALLRAGRFDRPILVEHADRRDRVDITKVHTRKLRFALDVDAETLLAAAP
jgi:cell division protease FtsH